MGKKKAWQESIRVLNCLRMHNINRSSSNPKSNLQSLRSNAELTLCEDLLSGLNSGQREAVLHREGPMLVTAGPGSGKTHVITTRLLYMILAYQVPPEKILVITFTKEAAKSMSSRFQNKLKESDFRTPLINRSNEASVSFGTFHSFYYQIIRSIPSYSGYRLIHEKEKKYILSQAVTMPVEEKESFIETLLTAISFYKNTDDIIRSAKRYRLEPEKFLNYVELYDQEKRKRKVMDFDDMLYLCLKSLREDPLLLKKWQDRFDDYLVDEFQDCNPVQYKILRMLACRSRSLFVVGDDDQAIYGFRGAESMILQRFLQDYTNAKQVGLGMNYRCAEQIVKASSVVIKENVMRLDKQLKANKPYSDDEKVTIRKWPGRDEMLDYMKDFFRQISGKELNKHAVLFRINQEVQMFAVELLKSDIPFQMKDKSMSIYEHFVVRDIMAFFEVANGNRERKLFLRILNKPRSNISREALEDDSVDFEKLKAFYKNPFMNNPAAIKDIEKLECALKQIQKMPLSLGIRYIRKAMDYERYLWKRADGNENLFTSWLELLDWLQDDAGRYKNLRDWKEHQKVYAQKLKSRHEDNEKDASKADKEKGVHLMTMHSSKGLEFEHCYILNVNDGVIPKYQKGQKLSMEDLEEERRIFYVGMTRAKRTLELHYLTGTKEHPKFYSRFIQKLID